MTFSLWEPHETIQVDMPREIAATFEDKHDTI